MNTIYFIEKVEEKDLNDLSKYQMIVSPNVADIKTVKTIKKVDKAIIKKVLDSDILVVINATENFEYIKYVIKNIQKLYENLCNFHKFEFEILNENSRFYKDIENCIKALKMTDKNERYKFIYETICNELDEKFVKCNYCDFKDDMCTGNRDKKSKHKTMGCCYSFEYTGLLDPRLIKNEKLCQYLDGKKCKTQNISCKLFTCKVLRRRGIKNDTHKILLLETFFDRKQHNIIQSNFFRTKEEVLKKLEEENHDLYFWYMANKRYLI